MENKINTIKEVPVEEIQKIKLSPEEIINAPTEEETKKNRKDLKYLKITVWTIIVLCTLFFIGKFFGRFFI